MQYVAAVSGKGWEVDRVKEQLLQSNPVLEGWWHLYVYELMPVTHFIGFSYLDLRFIVQRKVCTVSKCECCVWEIGEWINEVTSG